MPRSTDMRVGPVPYDNPISRQRSRLTEYVMLCGPPAVAGIMGQELLGRSPEWYNVGATPQFMPQSALLAIEFFVLGHFELKRYQGWNKHKTVSPSADCMTVVASEASVFELHLTYERVAICGL